MTAEQRKAMEERNDSIVALYKEGRTVAYCGKKHGLSRQRVQQILKKAGAWHPHVPSGRTKFLGVTVKEETKKALEEKAEADEVSVSEVVSDALDALVKGSEL